MSEVVFLAKFAHESNTFATTQSDQEAFQEHEEYIGTEIANYFANTSTVVGGALDVAHSENVALEYSVATEATPGGMVADDAYEYYSDLIVDDLRQTASKLDGVFLVLHGAMVPVSGFDGEGTLLSRVRNVVGQETPIVATLDLHGNVTDDMIQFADALIAYETHPHLDMKETGERGMRVLLDTIRGEIEPVMEVSRPPVLPHSPLQNTFQEPMSKVTDLARELERQGEIVKTNVLPGFHRADVPEMGFSVPIVADEDRKAAQSAARRISSLVWKMREEFIGDFLKPNEAVAKAKRLVETGTSEHGPVVLADFGPQPGGGGAADGTPTVRAMLKHGLDNAGYAIMRDPDAVKACLNQGVGAHLTLTLGGKTDDLHGDPITNLNCYVKAITDGTYVNTGTSHSGQGTEIHLGKTVRLECGGMNGITIILTELRDLPFDTEIWRHIGIPPERFDVITVTSTAAFRGDYEPIASEIIEVDSPGVSSPFPERFEYSNLQRPKFPLDSADEIEFSPTD